MTVQEHTGSVDLQMRVSGNVRRQFTVLVRCSGVSATDGDDFDTSSISVSFTRTKKTQRFTLPIVDDKDCEGEETLVCTVRGSVTSRSRGSVTVTIIDDSEDEADCNPGKQHWCQIVYRGTFHDIHTVYTILSSSRVCLV